MFCTEISIIAWDQKPKEILLLKVQPHTESEYQRATMCHKLFYTIKPSPTFIKRPDILKGCTYFPGVATDPMAADFTMYPILWECVCEVAASARKMFL